MVDGAPNASRLVDVVDASQLVDVVVVASRLVDVVDVVPNASRLGDVDAAEVHVAANSDVLSFIKT